MTDVPKRFDLRPIPTEELVEELSSRGIALDDLPWEDCGECALFREADTCKAGFRPVWFPEGPERDSNPYRVGFYAVRCPKRRAR